VEKVEHHIQDAVAKGATVVRGGTRGAGRFFTPTFLTGVTREMLVAREETFGPVSPLCKFNSDADAIALANDTEYGLAAYFYGRDVQSVWRGAGELEYALRGAHYRL